MIETPGCTPSADGTPCCPPPDAGGITPTSTEALMGAAEIASGAPLPGYEVQLNVMGSGVNYAVVEATTVRFEQGIAVFIDAEDNVVAAYPTGQIMRIVRRVAP